MTCKHNIGTDIEKVQLRAYYSILDTNFIKAPNPGVTFWFVALFDKV